MSVTAKKDLIKVKYRTTTKRGSISHSLLPTPLPIILSLSLCIVPPVQVEYPDRRCKSLEAINVVVLALLNGCGVVTKAN